MDEKKKQEIYNILVDYYIKAIDADKLSISDRKVLSARIIQAIDSAKSMTEVIVFLDTLSKDYAFFLPAYLKVKGKVEINKEKDIINKLAQYH